MSAAQTPVTNVTLTTCPPSALMGGMTSTPTTKPTPAEIAAEFMAVVSQLGAQISAKRSGDQYIVTLTVTFEPGNRDAYVRYDSLVPSALAILPMPKPGSVWGTDGGSVGGHVGLTHGHYRLSKSGVGVKVGQAIDNYRYGR